MNIALRLSILMIGLVFFSFIFRMLYVKHLEERNALIWIISVLIMCLLIIFPDVLDSLAFRLGVDYPPALLFLVSTLAILMILIHQAIQVSMLRKQVKELAELTAIHNNVHRTCNETGSYKIEKENDKT